MAKRGERGIGEREHARVYPNARSGAAARKQDERVCVGGGWRAPSPRGERAVRHCGRFPNEPVAPLRAGRQCKPLKLREIRSFGQCPPFMSTRPAARPKTNLLKSRRFARAGCRAVRDSTPRAWYRSVYAPRTGGAYDSHHRTAGIAGRIWPRGGRAAARGVRAAVAADGHISVL